MLDDKYLALRRLHSSHIIKEREHETPWISPNQSSNRLWLIKLDREKKKKPNYSYTDPIHDSDLIGSINKRITTLKKYSFSFFFYKFNSLPSFLLNLAFYGLVNKIPRFTHAF